MAKPELKILIGLHRTANAIDRKTAQIAAAHDARKLGVGEIQLLKHLRRHSRQLVLREVAEEQAHKDDDGHDKPGIFSFCLFHLRRLLSVPRSSG